MELLNRFSIRRRLYTLVAGGTLAVIGLTGLCIYTAASMFDVAAASGTSNVQIGLAATRNRFVGLAVAICISSLLVILPLFSLVVASIVRRLHTARIALERVAAGDFTQKLSVNGNDEIAELQRAIERMQDDLSKIIGGVRESSLQMSEAIGDIASGNSDLSGRTERHAASLQETAASLEEVTVTVRQNAESARTAQSIADSVQEVVARGAKVVDEAVQTMSEIDRGSQRVATITGVIEGIAFQTNILALNAAVEAARAGDHGRGFAVVAAEVRSLAQRAGIAAKEIATLIADAERRVEIGTRLVRRAGESMNEIRGSIAHLTVIAREISHASDEQRDGIEQVNIAVSQMDRMSQQNAALVEEVAAAAASLNDQTSVLRDSVGVFRLV